MTYSTNVGVISAVSVIDLLHLTQNVQIFTKVFTTLDNCLGKSSLHQLKQLYSGVQCSASGSDGYC